MRTLTGKRKSNYKKKDNSSEISDDEVEDISVVGNSVAVSIKGVRELIRAVNEGTHEFQDVVTNECSLIYECRVCQSLFRSVANLIAHKRHYCKKKFNSVNHGFHNSEPEIGNGIGEKIELENIGVNENKKKIDKLSSLECLPYIDLSILEAEASSRLENILPSSRAVFQTLVHNQKPTSSLLSQELRELEESNSPQATLLADGSAYVSGNNGKHKCKVCQTEFPTSRAMERHTNVYHQVRQCYPCPVCKLYFVSPWCVYRHLNKVHHKKEDQIRRLRQAVLTKAVKRELYQPPRVISETQVVTATNASKRAEEEKWNAQFETELQNCKTCNKSFSRRAALNVHSVMCKSRVKSPKSTEKSLSADYSNNLRCRKCNKIFNRRAVLSTHEAGCTNSDRKPLRLHVCKFCGRSYPRLRNLTLHLPNCPRAPPRSPLKHLLTPPKLSAAPKKLVSSPVQMNCDYNILPALIPRNGITASASTISSKLEAVVQKLHDNPTNSDSLLIKSQNNLSSITNNHVYNVNSKLILSPSIAPPPFKVAISANNKGLPSNRNVFFSVPPNGTVPNIIPFFNLKPIEILPNPTFTYYPDLAKLNPKNLNNSPIPNNFVTLDNKLFSPINGTVINNSMQNMHSTVKVCTNNVLNSKDKIKVVTLANKSVESEGSYIPHSKSYLISTKCAADSSSEVSNVFYSTPNSSKATYSSTSIKDTNAFPIVFKDIYHSNDSMPRVLIDDSGVSDDESLADNFQSSKFSPFKGFDPPSCEDLLSLQRIRSKIAHLDSQINLKLN